MSAKDTVDTGLCPIVEGAFTLLGKKWSALIIHVLGVETRRFSELLLDLPGISPRMLAERLKELELTAIVSRTVIPETPVRIEYALTEKGRHLLPLLTGIAEWAHDWAERDAVTVD